MEQSSTDLADMANSRLVVEPKAELQKQDVNVTINDGHKPDRNGSQKRRSEAYTNPVFTSEHETDNPVKRTKSGQRLRSLSEDSNVSREDQTVDTKENPVSRTLAGYHLLFSQLYRSHRKEVKWTIYLVLFLAYNVYLGFAIKLQWATTPTWCVGVKFLVAITVITYFLCVYYVFLKPRVLIPLGKVLKRYDDHYYPIIKNPWFFRITWSLVVLAIGIFIVIDSRQDYNRLISVGGLVLFVIFGYLFSAHPKKVIWRHVLWGILLQFTLGLLVLRWPVGQDFFDCLGNKSKTFLDYTNAGSGFVFGYLVTGIVNEETKPELSVFAFKVFSVVIFFSTIVSVLYYLGVMQLLVIKVGWFLHVTMGTTACESMSAAGNIFLGMTEAPLMIRPYLPILTKSELHAVMTGGFATIAGSVLAAYLSFGVNPSHLLSASVMSAPAALAYSKLFYPETEVSRTNPENITIEKSKERNAIEAAANGASTAISLVANIGANLIAFLACIQFLNVTLSWFGSLVGMEDLTFEWILSQIFRPLAFIMGVQWSECEDVGKLIGLKTIVNEFVAYQELGRMQNAGTLSYRAQAISVFALCGFSNISSIGISLGALAAMAPERKSDMAAVVVRAMIAGSIACFTTACVAGALLNEYGRGTT